MPVAVNGTRNADAIEAQVIPLDELNIGLTLGRNWSINR